MSSRVVVAAAKVVTTKDKEKKMTASKSWNAPVSKEEEAAIVAAVAENRAAAASLAVSMAMTPLSSMKAINPPSMEETRMNISSNTQQQQQQQPNNGMAEVLSWDIMTTQLDGWIARKRKKHRLGDEDDEDYETGENQDTRKLASKVNDDLGALLLKPPPPIVLVISPGVLGLTVRRYNGIVENVTLSGNKKQERMEQSEDNEYDENVDEDTHDYLIEENLSRKSKSKIR